MNLLQRALVLHRDSYRCAWCGRGYPLELQRTLSFPVGIARLLDLERRLHPMSRLQVDHIRGRSKRGPVEDEQLHLLLTLCPACHRGKTRKHAWESEDVHTRGPLFILDAWEERIAGARASVLCSRFGIREHELYRDALAREIARHG